VQAFFGYDEDTPQQKILTPIPLQNECGVTDARDKLWNSDDLLAARRRIRRRRMFRAWYKQRWGVEL